MRSSCAVSLMNYCCRTSYEEHREKRSVIHCIRKFEIENEKKRNETPITTSNEFHFNIWRRKRHSNIQFRCHASLKMCLFSLSKSIFDFHLPVMKRLLIMIFFFCSFSVFRWTSLCSKYINKICVHFHTNNSEMISEMIWKERNK